MELDTERNTLYVLLLHVFRQNARRKHGIVFSLLCSKARDEAGDRKKKLYNYVSVYESHFHYVTINMFSLVSSKQFLTPPSVITLGYSVLLKAGSVENYQVLIVCVSELDFFTAAFNECLN